MDNLLGRYVRLPIERLAEAGAFLKVGDVGATLLLPRREVPKTAVVGEVLYVFVCLDSEERPIATTRTPKLALGEVAFLEVTEVTEIGAFVDWGLGKELLVPFAEQSRDLYPGERHPFGLYIDRSERLAATMYVTDMMIERRRVEIDEWIDGVAWRNDPDIGLFAILEQRFVGLVPASEPHKLVRGQPAKFRVGGMLPDGKLVLSLRQHAFKEQATDAAAVLVRLAQPDVPNVGDRSPPDEIRALFGLSKKAFKRAIGHLLKTRAIEIDAAGFVRVIAR